MTAPSLPEVVGLTALTGIAGAPLPRLGPTGDDGASPLWDSVYSHVTGRTPFYDRFVSRAVAQAAGRSCCSVPASTSGRSACR
jgi:hypothetical protein